MIVGPILFALNLGLGIHQGSNEWTPPETTLPKEFVESVRFVISHGFADPRGGSFAIATIKTSNTWDPSLKDTKVRGWVLPSKRGQTQTIVVPNGLSYPVVAVIRGADINEGLFEPGTRDALSISELYNRGYAACACLLLTGNTNLAEKSFLKSNFNPEPHHFMGIANEYLNNRFHRAVEAHMRGDDSLALDDSFALQKDLGAYDQEAKKALGLKYFENLARPELGGDGKPIAFRVLKQIDALAEDSSRRLQKNEAIHNLDAVIKLPPSQRIDRLIEMLDQVSVRQVMQPGGVFLVVDPVVQAIVAMGNEAGPKLIDAIENDKRLTRSVSFGRDFFPDRRLHSVREAALIALQEISGITDFQGDRQPLDPAKLRAYWAKYGSMTPAERWLATLTDDSRSPRQWLAAAENIVDMRVFATIAGMFRGYREGENGPMHGESLRTISSPSVTDVMARRARMLFGASTKNSSDSARAPLKMCIALARWDPKNSVDCLREVSREIINFALKDKRSSFTFDYRGADIADVIDIRHQLGDAEALPDYVNFLTRMAHHSLTDDNSRGIRLLAKYSTEPICEKAVDDLFVREGGDWNLKQSFQDKRSHVQVKTMLASPLIALKPFRDIALVMLGDKTTIGRVWREGNVIHAFTDHSDGTNSLPDIELRDPLIGLDGKSMPLRECDQFAERFMGREWEGAPKFRRYWTVAGRDRAIEELIKYVDEVAPKVSKSWKWPKRWDIYPPYVLPPR